MQLLKYSDNVHQELIANKPIYEALRQHFTGEQQLAEFLGGNSQRQHYRIGELESGIVLATREPLNPNLMSGDYMLTLECDTAQAYMDRFPLSDLNPKGIQGVIEYCKQNSLEDTFITTPVCIGVQFRRRGMKQPSYALVVEDLSAGGTLEYTDKLDGDVMIPKGTNIKVIFDIPTTGSNPAVEFFDTRRLLVFEPE